MQFQFIRSMTLFAIGAVTIVTIGACDEETMQDQGLTRVEASDESVVSPAELGLGDEWIAVEPGLWTLIDDQGERKFLGIGEDGKDHALASLAGVKEALEQSLAERDSDSEREKLGELEAIIAGVREGRASAPEEEQTLRCSFDVGAFVDAHPIACGVRALATANFAHPCGTTKGTVQTYASASCGNVTKTHQCGPYSADPASCASETSITGPSSCSSFSFAKITGPNVYLYIWDQNNVRGYCGGGGSSTTLPYPDQCPGVNVECHAN
jgi:hypothetical protein